MPKSLLGGELNSFLVGGPRKGGRGMNELFEQRAALVTNLLKKGGEGA